MKVGEIYESSSGQQKKILSIEGTGYRATVTYKVIRRGAIPSATKVGLQRTQPLGLFKRWALKKVELL